MTTVDSDLSTEIYTYTFDDGQELEVCIDPTGLWHAGVSATVWDASLVLAKHLEKVWNSASTLDQTRLTTILSRASFKTVELGAGCSALPSLVLNRLSTFAGRVDSMLITDKEDALPLLHKTLANMRTKCIETRILDWTKELQFTVPQVDLVLMADVLAFPALYESLVATINSIASEETLVYLAYERRNFAAEVDFFRMWGASFKFELVPEDELHDHWRAPGEIYLYRGWKR